jgi:hypothetical protein
MFFNHSFGRVPQIRAEHSREIRNRHEIDDVKSAVSIHHLWCQSRHLALFGTRMRTPVSSISLRLRQAPPQAYNLVMNDRPSSCVFFEEGVLTLLRKRACEQNLNLKCVDGGPWLELLGRSQPIQLFFHLLFRLLRYVRLNSGESHWYQELTGIDDVTRRRCCIGGHK